MALRSMVAQMLTSGTCVLRFPVTNGRNWRNFTVTDVPASSQVAFSPVVLKTCHKKTWLFPANQVSLWTKLSQIQRLESWKLSWELTNVQSSFDHKNPHGVVFVPFDFVMKGMSACVDWNVPWRKTELTLKIFKWTPINGFHEVVRLKERHTKTLYCYLPCETLCRKRSVKEGSEIQETWRPLLSWARW